MKDYSGESAYHYKWSIDDNGDVLIDCQHTSEVELSADDLTQMLPTIQEKEFDQ